MLQKKAGWGHFIQNSQLIIYKDIIYLAIKLIGPNLFSRIEIYFTCYPIYRDLHTKHSTP